MPGGREPATYSQPVNRRHLLVTIHPIQEPSIDFPVRQVTADDAEALSVLMLDAYEGTIDSDGSETIEVARDEVAGYFSGASGTPMLTHSFVALADDRPVSAILVSCHEEVPLIAYLMTAASHKGRGLAGSMTALALSSLRAAGEDRAHLWVTAGNEPAERIYARLGFRDASGGSLRA